MKTLKAIALAAMMTIAGANATFAATVVKNHGHNAPAPRTEVKAMNNFIHQYEMAKRCNCKACRDLVKKVDQHIKMMNRNRHNVCHCDYCTHFNVIANHGIHPAPAPAPAPQHKVMTPNRTGNVAAGRR